MLAADKSENKEQFRQWLRDTWVAAYENEPFVEVLPPGQWPATKDVQGANTALMQIDFDISANKVIIICAIDNLVKGTAGSAIQSLNLALGLPETTALTVNGVAP
jgi:N-acetyl-gamma-glutamyl-phosphate reductase